VKLLVGSGIGKVQMVLPASVVGFTWAVELYMLHWYPAKTAATHPTVTLHKPQHWFRLSKKTGGDSGGTSPVMLKPAR
jgi:hypothetical protein